MSKKGGVSIPVFECLFNGSHSITSFTRSFDQALYEHLPHLYVVCLSKSKGKQRQLVGGFFIKTSYTHEDGADFQNALEQAVHTSQNLAKFTGPKFSMLPARLGIQGSEPLSEDEMLKIFSTQYLKFSTVGSA
ncbi:hypothetical protein K3169_04685 [Pseudomonas phytophila]|uniref:Uncharacterized protein n=1 Tax=Pseudomonas phytophila TaxID=2867264 RepID=A0ABY6FHZ5_9PSED|nr:hypothetical protein [Pseudomonas phytophila]UXZ97206.1 hypothetical protein K3169_04685 [Pseudomonas phytophila]